ncbi:hypothetical protein [Nostoc sp. 'Lobaria pulmonaria (5183) cyanobiont']|nr:hypothetical protein [Nostoc sp. 'Lobaria pulmonaria (5183) cyanobiont']
MATMMLPFRLLCQVARARNLGSTSSMELTGGGTSSFLIQRSC